jgi:hypothetical protein
LTLEVAHEKPDIGSIDPNITIDNIWMDDKLYFGMPVGSQDYEVTADESDQHHVIPTTS